MFNDVEYDLSIFGDFREITPNNEILLNLMEIFNNYNMLPSTIQEVSISQPARMTTPIQPPTTKINQLVAFRTSGGDTEVIFRPNRVDFNTYSLNGDNISLEKIDLHKKHAGEIFSKILEKYSKLSTRLALNSVSLLLRLTEEQTKIFQKRFTNNIPYYLDKNIPEWDIRQMIKEKITLGDNEDELNVIFDIRNININQETDGKTEFVRGYKIHLDINTTAANNNPRYSGDDIVKFINTVSEIRDKILSEILSGVE